MQLKQSLTLEGSGFLLSLLKHKSCHTHSRSTASSCNCIWNFPLQNELYEFQSEPFQVVLRLRLAALGETQQYFHFRTLRVILRARGRFVAFSFVLSLTLCCRTPCPLKFFSKQPQFPCFFTQIILLLNTILWPKMFLHELCMIIRPFRLPLVYCSFRVRWKGRVI